MKYLPIVMLMTLAAASLSARQDPTLPPAQAPRPLSAELLWQLDRVGAPVVSPDGSRVVVPVTRWDVASDTSETRLWLLAADGQGEARVLTAAGASASHPVFSPDGSKLAFISKRAGDEAGQIYVLPMDAPGEARRVTDLAPGVEVVDWVGEHLYFVARVWPGKSWDEMARAVKAKADDKVSAMVWEAMPYAYFDHFIDPQRAWHLFRMPAAGGDIQPLSEPAGVALLEDDIDLDDFDVSADESRIALVADGGEHPVDDNPDVFLFAPGATGAENITRGNAGPDSAPMFSPDGRMLAFARRHIPGFYGDTVKLMVHELATGRTRLVHGDWDRSATGLVWSPDSAGLFGAIDDAGTNRVYFLPLSGAAPVALTGQTDYDALSIASDGTLIARNQSFVQPPSVVRVIPEEQRSVRLDSFNDKLLADVNFGRYESVTYTGAEGAEIQMWVHYPPGFDPGRKWPLFLLLHGGPHNAITNRFHFRWNAQTFSSWGYVTAWPNFHGSSGFGQQFADSINPDWMSLPAADALAAADWFANQPWIDARRMVAGGGSYGGYLSTVLLGREHPFQALVIHAAVYDLYANSAGDFGVHTQRFGPYWEVPAIYQAISPHLRAAEFDTPSLILHGQNDLRVPVGQAFELFRTLQRKGVESKLVYFPDENHWILKPNNSLFWYGQVRDWIGRYASPGPGEAVAPAAADPLPAAGENPP